MHENEIANKVIGLAIEVHKTLGPGLLETVYKECLFFKIIQSGLSVIKEQPLPLIFEQVRLDCGYRMDLVVMGKLVVEINSIEELNNIHVAQILTYLKIGGYKLGLLINFNVILLKSGIRRVINGSL